VSVRVGAGVPAVVSVESAGAHTTTQQGGVMKAPVKSSRNTGDLSLSCLNELCDVYERAVREAGALWARGAVVGGAVGVEARAVAEDDMVAASWGDAGAAVGDAWGAAAEGEMEAAGWVRGSSGESKGESQHAGVVMSDAAAGVVMRDAAAGVANERRRGVRCGCRRCGRGSDERRGCRGGDGHRRWG
jgi:hypothetical protein